MLGPRREAIDEASEHIAAADAGSDLPIATELLTLRSPIDGIVDRITCKLGQTLAWARPSRSGRYASIKCFIWLPAFDVAHIRNGQSAEVFFG